MSSEKYVNYYIDTMTQTMNEFLGQSISLKSNLRIIEESLNEQVSLNEKLRIELENANSLLEKKQNIFKQDENMKNNLNDLRLENEKLRNDCITLSSEAQHVETFRNELLRARIENDELKKTIESLTNKPKTHETKETTTPVKNTKPIKDGGTF